MKGWTSNDIEKLKNRGMVQASAFPNIVTVPRNIEPEKIIPTVFGTQTIKGNVPAKSNCYKIITLNGHGSLAKGKALKEYEESFMWQCAKYRNVGINTPFEIYIDVFYPSKRSDLDNSLKVVMDCLQKIGAITNDNNCCKIVAQKFIDKDCPRIEFKIEKK